MPRIPTIGLRPGVQGPVGRRQASADDFAPNAGAVTSAYRAAGAAGTQAAEAEARAAGAGGQALAEGAAQLGSGLTRFGLALDELNVQMAKAARDSRVTKAKAETAGELQEYVFALKNGTVGEDGEQTPPSAPETRVGLYAGKVKEIRERYREAWKDDRGSFLTFAADFDQVAQRHELDVKKDVIDGYKAEAEANLDRALEVHREKIGSASDRNRPYFMDMAKRAVFTAQANGSITPQEAYRRIKTLDEDVKTADVMRLMKGTDSQVRKLASDLRTTPIPGIALAKQEQWIKTADAEVDRRERAADAAWRKSETLGEKASKKQSLDTFNEGISLGDKLTVDWVDARRDLLRDKYQQLRDRATKEPPLKSDAGKLEDLRQRARKVRTQADADAVIGDADIAYSGRKLTDPHYNRIVTNAQARVGQVDRPEWVKDDEDLIASQFGGMSGSTDAKAAAGRAISVYEDWIDSNPNPSRTDARKVAKQVIEDQAIRLESFDDLERPAFLVGFGRMADTSATEKKTKDAFDKKLINQAQLDIEGTRILAWKKRQAILNARKGPAGRGTPANEREQ